jgi:hypothetical protein
MSLLLFIAVLYGKLRSFFVKVEEIERERLQGLDVYHLRLDLRRGKGRT